MRRDNIHEVAATAFGPEALKQNVLPRYLPLALLTAEFKTYFDSVPALRLVILAFVANSSGALPQPLGLIMLGFVSLALFPETLDFLVDVGFRIVQPVRITRKTAIILLGVGLLFVGLAVLAACTTPAPAPTRQPAEPAPEEPSPRPLPDAGIGKEFADRLGEELIQRTFTHAFRGLEDVPAGQEEMIYNHFSDFFPYGGRSFGELSGPEQDEVRALVRDRDRMYETVVAQRMALFDTNTYMQALFDEMYQYYRESEDGDILEAAALYFLTGYPPEELGNPQIADTGFVTDGWPEQGRWNNWPATRVVRLYFFIGPEVVTQWDSTDRIAMYKQEHHHAYNATYIGQSAVTLTNLDSIMNVMAARFGYQLQYWQHSVYEPIGKFLPEGNPVMEAVLNQLAGQYPDIRQMTLGDLVALHFELITDTEYSGHSASYEIYQRLVPDDTLAQYYFVPFTVENGQINKDKFKLWFLLMVYRGRYPFYYTPFMWRLFAKEALDTGLVNARFAPVEETRDIYGVPVPLWWLGNFADNGSPITDDMVAYGLRQDDPSMRERIMMIWNLAWDLLGGHLHDTTLSPAGRDAFRELFKDAVPSLGMIEKDRGVPAALTHLLQQRGVGQGLVVLPLAPAAVHGEEPASLQGGRGDVQARSFGTAAAVLQLQREAELGTML